MSTAGARHKESRHLPKSHPFRNVLIVSLVLAALVLWQLTPIIHGLNALGNILGRAQGARRVIGGFLMLGYHKTATLIAPLIHRIK